MIKEVEIRNYKSIKELTLPLGRITVLIGANGSGKSNILEALAIGSAAANDKLDNEFLVSRGIRVSEDPRFMRSAFDKQMVGGDIDLVFRDDQDAEYIYNLQKDNERPYSSWQTKDIIAHSNFRKGLDAKDAEELTYRVAQLKKALDSDWTDWDKLALTPIRASDVLSVATRLLFAMTGPDELRRFLIFSPENSALRLFEQEGQIQPLGIRGEGLFKLLRVMSLQDESGLNEIKKHLSCIDWFSDFEVASDISPSERFLRIRDRYLDDDLAFFDQRSANEGFLFLLFYFSLFTSKETPTFFAIDNVDASLNPKLCSQLMVELCALAKAHGKQVVFTTHNPAILDGLDLTDDDQRLLVVSRNRNGYTRVKRIEAPDRNTTTTPVRLSEAFLRGYLGGLPDNF